MNAAGKKKKEKSEVSRVRHAHSGTKNRGEESTREDEITKRIPLGTLSSFGVPLRIREVVKSAPE